MISIKTFVFNPFFENTYVVYDESGDCIIIDPGCYEDYEKNQLDEFIAKNKLKVVMLINTHCHIDHVFGNHHVKDKYDLKLYIHQKDEKTLKSVEVYAPSYGFTNYKTSEADEFLSEGDQLKFGKSSFDVVFVPGHAPGHIALINEKENICFSGDVLFNGSIGRTDLPGGNFNLLIQSIHEELFKLSDGMVVYSGHGPETTIGKEKATNPFCAIGV